MKKIFTLILFFAMVNVAMAQISSLNEVSASKAYTLYNAHYTTYAVYNSQKSTSLVWAAGMTSLDHPIKDNSYKQTPDLSDASSSWMIVEFREKWYVYNLGAKKFMAVGYNADKSATASAKLQDTPVAVEFTSNGSGGFHLRSYAGDKNFLCVAPQLAYPVSIWTNSDNGATWQIKENPDVDADYETCIQKLEEAFPEMVNLTIDTRHGYAWSNVSGGALPNSIRKGKDYTFYVRGQYGWICPQGVSIRHGEEEYVVTDIRQGAYATEITIPAEKVNDDITISGTWERDPSVASGRVLTFCEEFNGEGEPSSEFWKRTERQNATWNRWCSNSPLVVFEEGGALHCRAIPNPDSSTDNVPMITGGVKTQGKFDFQWGRVEARIKTIPHTGTFPAFWMMPADNSKGWPNAGEIDIWETIDTGDRAYGTVHTRWTYTLGKGGNGGNIPGIDYSLWHVYAIEWTATDIKWYVDNQHFFTYNKSTDQNALDNGQWPFDAPFYIILNQSVGNGSWAANADVNFNYETLFDWVRVYQKPEHTAIDDVIRDTEESTSQTNDYYDISGRKLTSVPSKGVCIHNGNILVK